MGADSEARLLDGCRSGDPRAWEELFTQYYPAVARFVWQLGIQLTHEDVEEICQEAFLSVVRNLSEFKGQSRFQTWLFRIAVNKARDYREKLGAAKRGGGRIPASLEERDAEGQLLVDPPGAGPGPDECLARAETVEMVQRAVEESGDTCREIIELRYYADLSYEEISAALDLNIKTVSSRLSKCLDRLEKVVRQLIIESEKAQVPSKLPRA